MARFLTMIALIIATALWCGSASAQDDVVNVLREQTGLVPDFPYRECNTTVGAYRLAPAVRSLGGGKYCFTLKVQTPACSSACCSTDLHKIEFNVSSSCLVQPVATVVATINGVRTRIGAAFDRAPYGRPGASILRLTQLGLNTTSARDAEVCITLQPNRAGRGCTTLEQLCATSPGVPAGTCTAAMYDTACDCCPVSSAAVPAPPPPSVPPPLPSLVPAKARCEVCISSKLQPPPVDIRPYRYDNASCASIQQQISASINSVIIANNVTMVSYFTPNASYCTDTVVGVCGTFNATSDELALITQVAQQSLLPFWVTIAAGGNICRPELEGYTVEVTTDGNTCMDVALTTACNLPPTPPFPNCTCNTSQGILPFAVSPRYFAVLSSNRSTTTEFCFPVTAVPQSQVVPSTCAVANDRLAKIAWFADQSMSSSVRGFNLYPAIGSPTRISSSWGPPGSSTLKATGINWNATQANGGLVCVEIRKPRSMEDLCLATGAQQQCYLSVFNSNLNCCPTYRSGMVPQ